MRLASSSLLPRPALHITPDGTNALQGERDMETRIPRAASLWLGVLALMSALCARASAPAVYLGSVAAEKHLLERCAPRVSPVTLAALVAQESGGWPWTLDDDSTGESFALTTRGGTLALARSLIARGDSVDLGLAQINSRNLRWLGLDVRQALDPCVNLRAAQTVLLSGWMRARRGRRSGGRLRQTLSLYHSGRLDGRAGRRYSAAIFRRSDKTLRIQPVIPAIPGGRMVLWHSPPARRAGGGVRQAGQATQPDPQGPAAGPAESPLAPRAAGLSPTWAAKPAGRRG